MTALVPINGASLSQLDGADREVAVTAYLSRARDELALAVQLTGPEAVAQIKAQIATAAEATKQLGLSREIQQDAQEMVRRAEYALGKAIRAGQERGEIATKGVHAGGFANQHGRADAPDKVISSVRDFIPDGNETRSQVMSMVDGVSEPEFDAALSGARAEGNLSRANVVRKIKGVKQDGLTPVEKLVRIRELAPTGMTSGQIARELGLSEGYVRDRAREHGIEITADKVMGRTRRGVDSNHIVQETTNTLEALVISVQLVNTDDLDATRIEDWAVSLTDSIRALNRFAKQIKEKTQ